MIIKRVRRKVHGTEKSATCLEYLQAMKNELEGLNQDAGPSVVTLHGPKIYYSRKASGQASAHHRDLKTTTFSEDDCR
jgi:hypothetical protein